ncbi:MAG TPA: MFS transporter [Actinomycetota bacterium]|jgi:MFS family permease
MTRPSRRDFGILFSAYALSSAGDYLALITLTLKVEELTGSGWAVSGLLLAGLVPAVALATVAGYLVDRYETVRVLSVTALVQAAAIAGLAFADDLRTILALSLVLGAGVAVTQPALLVLVPRAIGQDRATQGNAMMEVARWVATPLGAVLGGGLTHALGHGPTLFADAATFGVVAVAVLAMRTRRPGTGRHQAEPSGELRKGVAFIGKDRLLRLSILLLGGMILFAGIDNVAEVFFAKDVLEAGDVGYGALVGAWTLGIAVGALASGRLGVGRLAPALFLASVIGGAAVALAAGYATLPVALAMFLVGGMANGVQLVSMRSLIHHRVPESLRGRVFAAYYGVVNASQITALGLGAILLEAAGARGSLVVAGTGAAAVGVLGLARHRALPARDRGGEPTPRTPPA